MSPRNLHWFENVETRPHPWPGLNWLTSMLYVPNCQEARLLYEQVFGFVAIFELCDDDGMPLFVRMRYRGSNFTISREGMLGYERYKSPKTAGTISSTTLYVYVDDVEQMVSNAIQNGCKLIQPAELQFWGDKKAVVEDPYGYVWELANRVQ